MAKRKSIIPGFSWNRVLGITSAKQKIARATGIPTTKQGRKRKLQSSLWTAVALGVAASASKGAAQGKELTPEEYEEAVRAPRMVRKIVLVLLAIGAAVYLLLNYVFPELLYYLG